MECVIHQETGVGHGRDCMVVGFITTLAMSAYHHSKKQFKSHSLSGVLDPTSCDKVCHWLAAGQSFSPDTLHDLTEIVLTVAYTFIWYYLILQTEPI